MKVLVTGGTTGLGKGIVDMLKQRIDYDIFVLPAKEIINAINDRCLKKYIDEMLADRKFDIIVNNFGIDNLSWIGDTYDQDSIILEGNVMTGYWVVNNQVKQGAIARVLNVSSITYRIPQRTTTIYCASKAAVVQMTKVMARELAPKGWVVNCYAPGKIMGTPLTKVIDEQVCQLRGWSPKSANKYALDLIPMKRFMSIDEAAAIACSILDMPDYVNGSVIDAGGGV